MTSLLYRGEALLRTGKIPEAAQDFREALDTANELGSDEEKWRSLYGLARVVAARGDRRASDEDLRTSIAIIEKMRGSTSAGSGRTGFLVERRDVYDLLIEHTAEQARPDLKELFRLMERSRARDLQDRLQSHPPGLDLLRSELPAGMLLIEYWLGRSALAAIAVSRDKAELFFERLGPAQESSLRDLPAALRDPARNDWRKAAQTGAALLTDRIGLMQSQPFRELVIVPDSYLGRIPFEALSSGDGLLIDRSSISYLPFAGAFQRSAPRHFKFPWAKTLEAFANPQPAKTGAGLALKKEETDGAIPDSSREVQNAADVVGGSSELFLGRAARKSILTASSTVAIPILHLATHAFADQENPERSYILFAGDKQGFDYLFLKEAEDLNNVRGSLVVVSACDSGTGKVERGEGIQSFASAFLAAGAKTVVTSLWRVGDRPSAELMTRFYQGLAAGEDASDALRNAKLSFRKSAGSASHPAYWAAFVIAGDGGLKLPWVIPVVSIAGAGLVAIAALGALVRMTAGRA
jgi:CHAT domain-containing protein